MALNLPNNDTAGQSRATSEPDQFRHLTLEQVERERQFAQTLSREMRREQLELVRARIADRLRNAVGADGKRLSDAWREALRIRGAVVHRILAEAQALPERLGLTPEEFEHEINELCDRPADEVLSDRHARSADRERRRSERARAREEERKKEASKAWWGVIIFAALVTPLILKACEG
jgi:hypothetical protein